MLITAVDEYSFTRALSDSFSIEACHALFQYYDEDLYGKSEYTIFDPAEIRCEWNEYSNIEDAILDLNESYGIEFENLNMEDLSIHTDLELEGELGNVCRYLICDNGNVLIKSDI